MPGHNFDAPRGRLERITIDSRALRGNLTGDPAHRDVWLYLPEGYDDGEDRYPLFVGLAGFTGSGPKLLSWQSFGENIAQRLDRLVAAERMGPVVLALPDGFTSLGGNQYINSAAMGDWEDFLLQEMLPEIESRFRVIPGARGRAVFGKSSGGYGAIVQGLRHGALWGAVACQSGDMAFDLIYRGDLPRTLTTLAAHDGDVGRFLEHLRTTRKIRGEEMHALMLLAMAATYDPDPDSPFGVRLPVDPHTGALDATRWSRWLAHDPVRLVEEAECQRSLRALGGLYVDCGSRDQYHVQYGARAFVRRLGELRIEHFYEEFDDDHSNVDYRLDVSLPWLYKALSIE